MPTYDYKCTACNHVWEEFQSITAAPTRRCPACRKLKAKRQIGPGAGLIFKGSGFYLTDYRSESYKKGAEAAKQAESSSGGGGSNGSGSGGGGGSSSKSDSGSGGSAGAAKISGRSGD